MVGQSCRDENRLSFSPFIFMCLHIILGHVLCLYGIFYWITTASISLSLTHTLWIFYIFSSIHLSSKIKYLYSIIWQYAIKKIENLFKMLCIDSHAHSQSECIYLYISLFTWCQGWCWNEINNHSIESKVIVESLILVYHRFLC